MAVADKNGLLKAMVQGVKSVCRAALTYPNNPNGAGRKGKCPRKHRQYALSDRCTESNNAPFTRIWHNNEPLVVESVAAVPVGKLCGQCGNDFPRGNFSDIKKSHLLSLPGQEID